MDIIKDRKGRDLTEAEEIKRGGKNIQNSTKKELNDPDNHDGVVIHRSQTSCIVKTSRP